MARAFDSGGKFPLVFGAGAGYSFGNDLSLLRSELLEHLYILIVDVLHLGFGESAYFFGF